MRHRFGDWLLILVYIALTALGFSFFIKTTHYYPPATSNGLRLGIAALLSLPFLQSIPRSEIKKIGLMAFLQLIVVGTLISYAAKYTSGNNVGFLLCMEIPFSCILGFVVLKERCSLPQLGGIAAAMGGAYLLIEPSFQQENNSVFLLLIIIAALIASVNNLILKFLMLSLHPSQISPWRFILAFPLSIALMFSFDGVPQISTESIAPLLAAGTAPFVGYFVFTKLIKLRLLSRLMPVNALMILATPVANYLVLNEALALKSSLGAALILISMLTCLGAG
jgi:drug/metabolite transporter (DMT)-like permease